MADNAFSRSRQLLLEDAASSANEGVKDTADATKELTREMSDAILAIKSLVNESKQFSNAKEYIDEATKAVSGFISEANKAGADASFRQAMSEMGRQIVDLQQNVALFSREMNTAFDANGKLKDSLDLDKVITDFTNLNQKVNDFSKQMEGVQSATEAQGIKLPDEVAQSFVKTQEEVKKLATELKALADVNPSEAIAQNAEGGLKSLREQFSETAEVTKAKGKLIRENTIDALSAGDKTDNGTIAILNQMSNALDDLGKISTSNNKSVGNMYSELQKLGGVDVSGVSKGLETYSHAMKELENAKTDLNKVLSDDHLSKDADRVHAALTKVMSIQEELVKTGRKVSDEYKSTGVGKLGVEQYEELNDEIGKIIRNYDEMARAAKNAGIEIDNAVSDDDYERFAQGGANASHGYDSSTGSKKGRKKGYGGNAVTDYLGDKVEDTASGLWNAVEGAPGKMMGLGNRFAQLTGLGALTSMTGLIQGTFAAGNDYGRLWRDASVADQGAGNGEQNGVHKDMFQTGKNWAYSTYGTIQYQDLERNRIGLTQTIGGQYGSQDGYKNASEMGELAKQSTLYQKGMNVSEGTINQAINQFYKEYNTNLTDTEFLLSKVANQSQDLNIPMEQHLKNVMQLSESYRSYGLSVEDAQNALGNLMSPNSGWGMNQADAMNMSSQIGSGMGNMSDGMAAYSGMMFGGASNPFEAIWDYKDKWNADGSEKEGWAEDTTKLITGMAGTFKNMAGGDPDAQKYLQYQFYKNEMKMDEKTSVQLANTNDPEAIKRILEDMGKGGEGTSGEEMESKLLSQIETASSNLSGVDKTIETLKVAQVDLAESQKGWMDSITDFSKQVIEVKDFLDNNLDKVVSGFDKVDKKIEELMKNNENLMAVIAAATLILGTLAVAGGVGKVGAAGAKELKKLFTPKDTPARRARKEAREQEKAERKAEKAQKKEDKQKEKERKNRPGNNSSDNDSDSKDDKTKNKRNSYSEQSKRYAQQKQLPPPKQISEQQAKKLAKDGAKLSRGLGTAGKIGGRAILGGIGAALLTPAMEFGSKLGDGKITSLEAKTASKDTGATWATVGAGAAIGAGIGSIIPGAGTLVGAGVGAAVGGVVDVFSHEKVKQLGEKAGKSIKETGEKAGAGITAAAVIAGGALAKSGASLYKYFAGSGDSADKGSKEAKKKLDNAGKESNAGFLGLGTLIGGGAAAAKKFFGKAGSDSKKDLEKVGKDTDTGSKNAKKDLDKAAKGTKSDIESVGKNAGKGYDKAKKDIEDKKSDFDKFIDGLFGKDDKKLDKKKKDKDGKNDKDGGGFFGDLIGGIKGQFSKLFGGNNEEDKQYRKDTEKYQRDISKSGKDRKEVGDKHLKEANDQGKTLDKQYTEQKERNKQGDKHLKEASEQGKTLDKSHDEQKKFGLDLKEYAKDKFPKFTKEFKEAQETAKKLTEKTNEELVIMGGVLSAGFATLTEAINGITTGNVAEANGDVGSPTLKGNDNAEKAFNFLKENGFSDQSASAIIGNWMQESGMDPKAVNSIGATGIAQWLNGREKGLKKFAKSKGKKWDSLDTQLAYFLYEINNEEKGSLNRYGMTWDEFKKGTDINTLTKYFRKGYERAGEREANDANRISEANNAYASFAGGGDAGGDTVKGSGNAKSTANWYLDNYKITSGFGQKESFRNAPHDGVDIDGKMGDLIKNIASGTVVKIATGRKTGESGSFGNQVQVKHADGTVAMYAHLKDVAVKVGQKLEAGAKIGTMGNTGSVFSKGGGGDGSHLHLGLYKGGYAKGAELNSEKWLRDLAKRNAMYYGGDAGGDTVKDYLFDAGGDSVASKPLPNRPIHTGIASNSIYGLGQQAATRGLYKGSLAYSYDGVNHVQQSRQMASPNSFQINVYSDPGNGSDYYKKLAKYIETKVKEAEKNFAEQYAKSRSYKA